MTVSDMTVSITVYLIVIAFQSYEDKKYKTIGSLVNIIKRDDVSKMISRVGKLLK